MKRLQLRLRKARKGFTLIELLVVLVILALLAGLVLPQFLGRGEQAKVQAAKTQMGNFKSAIELFKLDHNGNPPETLDELRNPPQTSSGAPANAYLEQIPADPWDKPYDYKVNDDRTYVIISYGADGKEGGDGLDADIASTDPK